MKVKTKFIFLFLICLALILFVPNKANAATYYNSEISYNEYTNWSNNTKYIEVVAAGEHIESATIPSKINGITVTAISDFENCTNLKSISIPNTVTSIDTGTFRGCTSLKNITIPNSVKEIGAQAFAGCTSLTSIVFPSGITSFGDVNFTYGILEDCTSLKSVTLPSNLTWIPSEMFSGCTALTSVTIPSKVTKIGLAAFKNCKSLTSITIPATVTEIQHSIFATDGTFYGCTALTTAKINAKSKVISSGMFYGCSKLTSVTFSDSFTEMGGQAFENCTSLRTITLPSNLTNIANAAFRGCTNLSNISIPDSVTEVSQAAFVDCKSLTSISFPCGVRKIQDSIFDDDAPFYGCSNLRTVYFTKTIQEIGDNSFAGITPSNLTFYGYSGTAAKTLANEKGYRWVECTPVSSISISGASTVNYGKSITLTGSVSPSNAYNKNLKWTSSNNSIATVSSTGVVTGKGVGTVTIKAISRDGTAVSASKTITVKSGVPFNDIKVSAWYFDALTYMYSNRYISGTTSTTFSPNMNLSRGMLVTILWNMEGRPNVSGANKFSDVTNVNAWYYKAIIWASQNRVVNGYKDGTFMPNKDITREETAAILMNYSKYKGKYNTTKLADLGKYGDNNLVSPWAKTAMQWAVGNRVVNGINNGTLLSPNTTATRAEAITMIKNYVDRIK